MSRGLVRTGGGQMLHRRDCPALELVRTRPGSTFTLTPWANADGPPWGQVVLAAEALELTACETCRPLADRG